MTSIHTTIADTLNNLGVDPDSYSEQVSAVEHALLEREYSVSDQLTAIALRETSYSEEDLAQLFEQVGLSVRPKPEPEPVVEDEVAALFDESDTPVSRAEFSAVVGKLDKLILLAERHFGVNL
jgi:hypothetical protein